MACRTASAPVPLGLSSSLMQGAPIRCWATVKMLGGCLSPVCSVPLHSLCSLAVSGRRRCRASLDGQSFTALLCLGFPIAEQPQGLFVADSGKVKALNPQSRWRPQAREEEGTPKGTLCALPWGIGI